MTAFAVEYAYSSDKAAVRDEHRASHREWLGGLLSDGRLLASGPYAGGAGALLLFAGDDEPTLRALLAQDPFAVAGAIADTRITGWDPVIGPFAD